MQLNQSPFDTGKINERRVEDFEEYIWYNSEICNGCYTRVRSVGEEQSKMLETPKEKRLEHDSTPPTLSVNDHYERTDDGSQEYSSFDTNKRFGTCFCLNCGSDCSSFDEVAGKDELKEMAERIAEYTEEYTPLDIDDDRLVRETGELKAIPQTDGWDTEILAVAFSRSLL